jgi:prepilin-type N-terminal cleavage/methylation domain-containing protein/prepilin-type processing-associated H-X9-DG protein
MNRRGFTLIELLSALVIVSVLVALMFPALRGYREKGDGLTCLSNLRQLGATVNTFVAQNDGHFPEIEPDPENPIYPKEENAKGLLETLAPYGITPEILRCPADMKSGYKYFEKLKTSYEWRPYVDDELQTNPQIFTRGGQRTVPSSKVVLAYDVERVHGMSGEFKSKKNYLYGDGHVRAYWETAPRTLPKK